MLYLISMGLHDEKDMSIKAVETAKKCKKIYAEFYTMKMFTNTQKLGKLLGKKVEELKRKDLEEGSGKILEEAKTKNIGILIGGDALTATTHTSILLDAKKMNVRTEIIHGSSIYTAVTETGLHIYKFGKTTTIAYPEKNYDPTSFYETITENKKMGLHTLILLDVKSEKNKFMDIKKAVEILLETEKKLRKKNVSEETKIVSACVLGGSEIIKYGKIKDIIKDKELKDKTPAVIIIPGSLHFTEKEFLEHLK